jgi:hypothetical protein
MIAPAAIGQTPRAAYSQPGLLRKTPNHTGGQLGLVLLALDDIGVSGDRRLDAPRQRRG